jgi:hypothetical protein
MGYDSSTKKTYLNVYGDTYIGDRDKKSYLNFDTSDKTLYIKGIISAESTINGSDLKSYFN